MRCLGPALLASLAIAPPAAAEPLYQADLQLGYGLAMSGSGTGRSRRASPLTITATAAIALDDAPPLLGYGGMVVEALDRNAVGVAAGVRVRPTGGRLRLAGGTCWYVPDAVVSHVGSAVTGLDSAFAIYHGHRNLAWMVAKDMPTADKVAPADTGYEFQDDQLAKVDCRFVFVVPRVHQLSRVGVIGLEPVPGGSHRADILGDAIVGVQALVFEGLVRLQVAVVVGVFVKLLLTFCLPLAETLPPFADGAAGSG
mgnify:CR=1 FL=1